MPKKIKTLKDALRRLRSASRLKSKKLKKIHTQVAEIDKKYHRDKYDKLRKEFVELSNLQDNVIRGLISINNKRLKESPDIKYIMAFVDAIVFLLQKGSPYASRYGLERGSSGLLKELIALKKDYIQAYNNLNKRQADTLSNSMKRVYALFIDREFGLSEIGDLNIRIRDSAKKGLKFIGSLRHPTGILKQKDVVKEKKDMGNEDREKALKRIKEAIAKNVETVEAVIEMNKEEMELSKVLEKRFIREGMKNQLVIAKLQKN